jgi:HSP20 family protein
MENPTSLGLDNAVAVPITGAGMSGEPISFGRDPGWSPAYDLRIDGREIVAYVDLPGIDEDALHIDVHNGSFHVHGERPFDHDAEDAEEFVRLGRPYGAFDVSVTLPAHVDPNGATARYRRGVLRLRLPLVRNGRVAKSHLA